MLDSYEYSYDLRGNKIGITRNREGLSEASGNFNYIYDDISRLTGVERNGEALRSYEYDNFGNRTVRREGSITESYTYNALNQLISKTDVMSEDNHNNTSNANEIYEGAGGLVNTEEVYKYDRRGNLTEMYKNGSLTNQYHFGALNRLEKAFNHESNQGAEYTYNGLGHRIGKTEGMLTEPIVPIVGLKSMQLNPTKKIDDVIDITKQYHNLLERAEQGNVNSNTNKTNLSNTNKTSMFTWDRNVISASIGDEHLLYMHDELGSPSRILDEMSDTVEMHNFDEFGNEQTVENELLSDNKPYQTNGSIQPFTYTGYQRDDITSTYYAQAREYLPSTGRFTGEDIIKGNGAYPHTLNQYSYCWNRPMDLVDLNGMYGFGYYELSPYEVQDWVDNGNKPEEYVSIPDYLESPDGKVDLTYQYCGILILAGIMTGNPKVASAGVKALTGAQINRVITYMNGGTEDEMANAFIGGAIAGGVNEVIPYPSIGGFAGGAFGKGIEEMLNGKDSNRKYFWGVFVSGLTQGIFSGTFGRLFKYLEDSFDVFAWKLAPFVLDIIFDLGASLYIGKALEIAFGIEIKSIECE